MNRYVFKYLRYRGYVIFKEMFSNDFTCHFLCILNSLLRKNNSVENFTCFGLDSNYLNMLNVSDTYD